MWPNVSGPAVVCEGMLDMISQPRLLGSSKISFSLPLLSAFLSVSVFQAQEFSFSFFVNGLDIYMHGCATS